MKGRYLFLLVFTSILFCAPAVSQAQMIKGAVIGGFNLSQVDGDEVYGFNRIGLNVGVSAIIPLSERWSVALENSFNQKGAYQKQQYYDSIDGITGEYNLRLNYVSVPLTVQYHDMGGLTFGAGFSWDRLVGFTEVEHGGLREPYSDSIAFNENDFNIIADIRFRIYKRLKFNLRYAYSIVPIREREFSNLNSDTWMRKQYNNNISFRLIYVFNERLPAKPEN